LAQDRLSHCFSRAVPHPGAAHLVVRAAGMFMFDAMRDLLLVLGVRLRRRWRLEVIRFAIQWSLFMFVGAWMVSLCAMPLVCEYPWNLPFRVYRDTFGNFEALWRFEPPMMERSRYMKPGNMWRPFLLGEGSELGNLQDQVFTLWNWGSRCIWKGPIHAKVVAAIVGLIFGVPALLVVKVALSAVLSIYFKAKIVQTSAESLMRLYLLWSPEWLLLLDQLYWANWYGRRLSPGAAADVEAANFNPETMAGKSGLFDEEFVPRSAESLEMAVPVMSEMSSKKV